MIVYVATAFANYRVAKALLVKLRLAGMTNACDWQSRAARVFEHDYKPKLSDYAAAAVDDKVGIEQADAVVVILPGGRGTHTELGMAIALGKRIVIVDSSPDLESYKTRDVAFGANGQGCTVPFYFQTAERHPHRPLVHRLIGDPTDSDLVFEIIGAINHVDTEE